MEWSNLSKVSSISSGCHRNFTNLVLNQRIQQFVTLYSICFQSSHFDKYFNSKLPTSVIMIDKFALSIPYHLLENLKEFNPTIE